MNFKKLISIVAFSVTTLVLSAGHALAAGKLEIVQRQDPANWDPIDTFLIAWGQIGSNLYDGLTRRDENLELHPGLATQWDVLDDGKRIRFKLREGVSFHNGEPFNANAVKYTFDRLLGEAGSKGPQRSNYTVIDSVEIIDDFTVDMHLNAPAPVLLTKLSGYGAMIVPPKYIEEKGEEYFDLHPVGTGPFKFESYNQGVDLTLVANPDYFEGAPKLDALHIRFIREDATRLAELQAGRAHVVNNVPFSAIPVIDADQNASVVSVSGPTIYSYAIKTKDAITADVRVRRALNMAVDKQAITDTFFAGKAKPIASVQGELSFGYDPELEGYPYDPEMAKQLLTEAGIAPGTELTLDYRSGNTTFSEVTQALTGFFNAIGFKTNLNPLEDAVFLNEIVPKGQTSELFQFSWGGWTFDFDNTAYLSYHNGEKWNPYGTSEAMNNLLEAQRQEVDIEKRREMLQQVARLAHEEAYHIPLYVEDTLYALANSVEGFVPAPDNRLRFLNVSIK